MLDAHAPKRIIICATQRSGSTLLCNDLANNGLGRPEEHFLVLVNNLEEARNRDVMPGILRRGTCENNIFAVKIMANYAPLIDDYLGRDMPPTSRSGALSHLADAFSDAYWIFLERRDLVSQAVSRLISNATGVCHAIVDDRSSFVPGRTMLGRSEDYNSRVALSDKAIRSAILQVEQENESWMHFFQSHNLQPLSLMYEDFICDFSHVLKIRRDLGLSEQPVITSRNLLKIGNQHSADIIAEFKRRRQPQ